MKTLNDFERVTSQKFGNESKVKIPETKSCVGKSSVEFFWPQFTQIEHYSLWFRLNRRVLQKIWIIVMSC